MAFMPQVAQNGAQGTELYQMEFVPRTAVIFLVNILRYPFHKKNIFVLRNRGLRRERLAQWIGLPKNGKPQTS